MTVGTADVSRRVRIRAAALSLPRWVRAQALVVSALPCTLVPIQLVHPQFFLVADKQVQYLPVMADIGRRLRSGEFLPVIDPALGPAGNYALDPQYGLYDPFHWLVAVLVSSLGNQPLAAFLWSATLLLVLAAGTCALVVRTGASACWAAAAGLAVSTSGFVFFWLAPYWMPGLASIAWLPWWWWAATDSPVGSKAQRSWRVVSIAVFAFLVVIAGWPATWLMLGAAVVGLFIEQLVRRDPTDSAGAFGALRYPRCPRQELESSPG